ncbi:substrate-binding domain-containing protein [Streptomyces sp. C10-9-1]|uniref:LacI family DNA-binding transcriptional regulator n=1 Tax=Streptomyces sp. C10-9-1 TaxID=1859285 RepID=UPI003D75444E
MLAAERRSAILSRARREGAVRVADLVTQLGVSDVTIRRDLDGLVTEGLLEKVHGGAVLPDGQSASDAPSERAAAPCPSGEVHRSVQPAGPTVGVLVPKSSYYFKSMIDGIRSALAPHGGRIVMAASDYAPEREPDLVKGLLEAGAKGLLLAPSAADAESGVAAAWACTQPVPTVLLERRAPEAHAGQVSWVRTAHESGAAASLRHLHDLGHERIALFTRGDTPTSLSVERGWQRTMSPSGAAAGLLRLSGRDFPGWPRWARDDVRQLVDRLRDAEATALLCHSDEDALDLLQEGLGELVSIPDELSVVAYDDEVAEFASPALTAVSPPKRVVGRLAAHSLLDLLDEPGAPIRHIEVEPTLVVRGSTRRT